MHAVLPRGKVWTSLLLPDFLWFCTHTGCLKFVSDLAWDLCKFILSFFFFLLKVPASLRDYWCILQFHLQLNIWIRINLSSLSSNCSLSALSPVFLWLLFEQFYRWLLQGKANTLPISKKGTGDNMGS